MGDHSTIEWTDATWNPVTGCTHVSEGCRHCYAERVLPRTGQSFDQVVCHENRLTIPLHWQKPRRIFVNSLSDLFHEDVPNEFIDNVFGVMALAPQHTFQLLTKRPTRMQQFSSDPLTPGRVLPNLRWGDQPENWKDRKRHGNGGPSSFSWPLPNVWKGVSVEDQKTADERIPLLLQTPAAVRFISAEPLIGPIDISPYLCVSSSDGLRGKRRRQRFDTRLDWCIVGGESGPGARPMHPDWAMSLRDQCQAASVPFFFKQWGEWVMLMSGRGDTSCSRQVAGMGLCSAVWMTRFGKKASGRILDGRTWDEMPNRV